MNPIGLFKRGLSLIVLMALPAAIMATYCWPTNEIRTEKRMALAGVLTVFYAFVLTTFLQGLFSVLHPKGGVQFFEFILSTIGIIVLGSIMTLGIPYILGAFISQLFVSED